ncbi:hypothetical protein TRFO_05527 [Tritrichomonas foetus]|uniref:Uncharacterized protein n=1 Tax=Tritrichomonas foetus TaxID=1144522 RepID=A0A1J4K4I0_9EUKA|nr:hypothetical protein TRFO_05527 [Tritrichomonas foetus]|eukprot:OHT06353.1 hypothetical protein TRFO_05527 [Tritrichomonas foetus]
MLNDHYSNQMFSFRLKDEVFKCPLNIIAIRFHDSINDYWNSKEYVVKSNVSKETFLGFLHFIEELELPQINIHNVQEFKELNQEFRNKFLNLEIERFEKEYCDSESTIKELQKNINQYDMANLEEMVSKRLDYFLINCPKLLASFDIDILYRIFFHKSRRLHDHNLAFHFIQDQLFPHEHSKSENNILEIHNIEYLLLFNSLDATKLSEEILFNQMKEQYFQNYPEYYENIPKLQISYYQHLNQKLEMFESEIEQLKTLISQQNEQIEKFNNSLKEINKNINIIIGDVEIRKEEKYSLNNIKKVEATSSTNTKIEKISKIKIDIPNNMPNSIVFQNPKEFCYLNNYSTGILSYLKEIEGNSFEPLFITCLSSYDPYDLMLPNWNGEYYSSGSGHSFLKFLFRDIISISGIILQNAQECYFQGFKILINEDEMIYSTKGEQRLNGKNKIAPILFEREFKVKSIKIIQDGISFDNHYFFGLKQIDFIKSLPSGYSFDEYFNDLLNNADKLFNNLINNEKYQKDPHLFPVRISTDYFSTEDFYSQYSQKNVFSNGENAYVDFKILHGFVVIDKYRLKKSDVAELRSWKILGSFQTHLHKIDETKWTLLSEIIDDVNSNCDCIIYPINTNKSCNIIRIQLISTWIEDDQSLVFQHLEFFGKYYPFC